MTKNLNDRLIEKFIADEMRAFHGVKPDAVLLEIGCGDLRYMEHCTKPGWHSVFSDYEIRNGKISVRLDAHFLPFRDSSFDIVLMTEVLEHLHHPAQGLKEISRVMKTGQTFIFTVPFLWGLHELPNDYVRYTEFGLKNILEDANFKIERFQRRGDLIGVIFTLWNVLVGGGLEYLRRARTLFFLAAILSPISNVLERLMIAVYLRLFGKRLSSFLDLPGNHLKGVAGMLSHWHLGYNVVCRKV